MTDLSLSLRFDRRDTRRLRAFVDKLQAEGADESQVELFDKAAESANSGEPLLVHAESVDEVKQMAAGFVLYGLREPVLEDFGRGRKPVSG